MTDVLLSVKPEYAEKILDGKKKYEFRRAIFKINDIKKVYIYSSSPIRKIIALFEIERILKDSPERIWTLCQKYGGISKKDFFDYFRNSEKAFAIEIGYIEVYSLREIVHALSGQLRRINLLQETAMWRGEVQRLRLNTQNTRIGRIFTDPCASASTVTPVDCVHTYASALAYVDVYSAQSVSYRCSSGASAFISVHQRLIFYREMRERGALAV